MVMKRHGERSDKLKVFQQRFAHNDMLQNARLLQKLEAERFGGSIMKDHESQREE